MLQSRIKKKSMFSSIHCNTMQRWFGYNSGRLEFFAFGIICISNVTDLSKATMFDIGHIC